MRNKIYLLIATFAGSVICFGYSLPHASAKRPSLTPTPTPKVYVAPTPPPIQPKKPLEDPNDVIKVASKLVVVPVSVSDANGNLVKNLHAGDFLLKEEGQKQEIESLNNPEAVPLDLALLIDVSGSTNKRFPFEKKAAESFLRQVIRSADGVTIFTIDEKLVLVQPRTTLESAIDKLRGIDAKKLATAFFDTVAEAAQYFRKSGKPGHRRVVVVISDGEDTYSQKYKSTASVITELQQSDTLFYSINPGAGNLWMSQISQRGQDVMGQMAASTGGVAFVPKSERDLEMAFRQIAVELRSQYLLQYYSSDEAAKRGFVPITVETPKSPELRIRSRQGYYP